MPARKLTDDQNAATTVVEEYRALELQVAAFLETVRADRDKATAQAIDEHRVPIAHLARALGMGVDRTRIYEWRDRGRGESG